MDKEIIITLCGIVSGFALSSIFVIRYMVVKGRFPWQRRKK